LDSDALHRYRYCSGTLTRGLMRHTCTCGDIYLGSSILQTLARIMNQLTCMHVHVYITGTAAVPGNGTGTSLKCKTTMRNMIHKYWYGVFCRPVASETWQ
jgi:hypothetical protein